MNKGLTNLSNINFRYLVKGVNEFSKRCKLFIDIDGKTSCPYKKCLNGKSQYTSNMFCHIVNNGFDPSDKNVD